MTAGYTNKTTSKILLLTLVLTFLAFTIKGEVIFECPDEWTPYAEKCYKFVVYPALIYAEAKTDCGTHGASLVGVNTQGEHVFISNWLLQNDLSRGAWFTSGVVRNMHQGDLEWESDGSTIPPDGQYWVNEEHRNYTGIHIVYVYAVTQYGWSRSLGSVQQSYICEIALDEAYRIIQEERDFDYGTNITDPNDIPHGPKFSTEPYDMVEIGSAFTASIECVATGMPKPSYRIFQSMDNGSYIEITPSTDDRYSITNGRLIIADPREVPDAGRYHCEAENRFGKILSRQMQLSFGHLGEFSNVDREPVRAQTHSYAIINCDPPGHKPAVAYNWIKGTSNNFIRTDINPHVFISYNGKIYFSEVTTEDATTYKCVVKLISDSEAAIGSNQPPSGVSLPIALQLIDNIATDWGPEISNDFIASFPRLPKRGNRVRLECLAYGTMPITYSWERVDLPLPTTVEMDDHNRIMYIENIQLEDAGTYICHAKRGSIGQAQKSFNLQVEALPYFIYPLRDQHADIGSKLTWRCEARGTPKPTYAWLKNGEPLVPVPGDIAISHNLLTITSLDPEKHNGVYQCSATNTHGTVYSSGQVRVLAFKPSFEKHPLEPSIMGTVGGNVTIICNPEAAPSPTYRWSKDGGDLNLGDGDTTSRIRKLKNGNLFISPAQASDTGRYGCTAENLYGSTTSSGNLEVIAGLTITNPPASTTVLINNTAFLMCQASIHPDIDMVYDWHFEGASVNFKDPHYRQGDQVHLNGLYVIGAQRRHQGRYACLAKSSFERVTRTATLTVLGPPGYAAGLYIEPQHTTQTSIVLFWTPGPDHGRDILTYSIFLSTTFNATWRLHVEGILERDTIVEGRHKRRYVVEGLKPGNGYQFKVRATNIYGAGPASVASHIHQTPTAAPVVAPEEVGGGGGSVGDLVITWQPLPREEHGGPGIGYIVYWRVLQGANERFAKFNISGDASRHVVTVGQDMFYTQYEVIVQAYNERGQGPNSTMQVIYSAEDMPLGVPSKVYSFPYNSTAINVTWTVVPNTKEVMKGEIKGYRINYQNVGEESHPQQNIIYTGQVGSGLVIGLEPFKWYRFDVQSMNSAGLGPISEIYNQRTWGHPPLLYPTEVYVFSHGPDSVNVNWRGISTGATEEPIVGYKVRYWAATDDIRTSYDHLVGKISNTVVYGVSKDSLYKLRVFAYSRGGDGKMSPDVYFTLGGIVRVDPETAEIIAGAETTRASVLVTCILSTLTLLYLSCLSYLHE